MHRFILPLALAAGLAFAGSASAAAPSCEGITLDSTALQTGTQPVTLTGAGNCTQGTVAVGPAPLTLSGTATVGSCFASPYVRITGTLTMRDLDGVVFFSTPTTMTLLPDAGASTGLGTLTYGHIANNPFEVSYSDTVGGSAIGLISRCGGGEFTFRARIEALYGS